MNCENFVLLFVIPLLVIFISMFPFVKFKVMANPFKLGEYRKSQTRTMNTMILTSSFLVLMSATSVSPRFSGVVIDRINFLYDLCIAS